MPSRSSSLSSVPVVGAEPLRPGESVPAFEPEPLVEPEPAFGGGSEPVFGAESVVADDGVEPAPEPEPLRMAEPATGHPAPLDDEPAPPWRVELDTSRAEPFPPIDRDGPQSPRMPEPVLAPVGAFSDATAPRPAWSAAGELAWMTADAGTDPTIRRREGPVPGVWKRSRRAVGGQPERDN